MSEHSSSPLFPLIVIADDTPDQIQQRMKSICSLLQRPVPALDDFKNAGSLVTSDLEIQWDSTDDIMVYLTKAQGRRTLFVLDIAWPDKPLHGLDIARAILKDEKLAQQSILLLKSTDVPADAEEFTRGRVLPLRCLRSGAPRTRGRLRTLAANRVTDVMPYDEGMIAQALLDLQEEMLFDALAEGQWSAADTAGFIKRLEQTRYFGAFKNDKALGELYRHRVLDRYSQHFATDYLPGPLNIGIAQVMAPKGRPTTSLKQLRDRLITKAKTPETIGLISALMEYREVAALERHLFALPLKSETQEGKSTREMKTISLDRIQKSSEQTWRPVLFGSSAQTIKRSCELGDAEKALETLESVCRRNSGFNAAFLADLKSTLNPQVLTDVLQVKRLVNGSRTGLLAKLPEAILELLETQFDAIEQSLIEGVLPGFDGMKELLGDRKAELVTLEWEFGLTESSKRTKSGGSKRVRLLNRRLFEHPAVEAARIMALKTESKDRQIVRALKTYCQSPEAIAALVDLREEDAAAFSRCVAALASTECDHRLPHDFNAFDKAWVQSGKRRGIPLRDQLADVTVQRTGPQVSLLQMLVAHLAMLEYRIGCFCLIMNYADEEQSWKNALAENLKDLWAKRRWDRIFSLKSIAGAAKDNPFRSRFTWSGELLSELMEQNDAAKTYHQNFISYLAKYEIEIKGPNDDGRYEASYKEAPPIWLRIGNVVLPLEIITGNLEKEPELLANDRRNVGSRQHLGDSIRESKDPNRRIVEAISHPPGGADSVADQEEEKYLLEAATASAERAEEIKQFLIRECGRKAKDVDEEINDIKRWLGNR